MRKREGHGICSEIVTSGQIRRDIDRTEHSLELLADIVDGYILDCILIHLLGQVDRDPKEISCLSAPAVEAVKDSRSV